MYILLFYPCWLRIEQTSQRADFLWLIFIGRCVAGIGLVSFMYT